MHIHNITEAQYQSDYKILLAFDDGKQGVVNLKDFIFSDKCGVFKRLQDKDQFKNFVLEHHTLIWQDDLDLAPEFLYDLIEIPK